MDLDQTIEARTGTSITDLLTADLVGFRTLEKEALHDLLKEHSACVISVGAGLEEIPNDVLVIWVDREGWEDDAKSRPRLRPSLSFDEEIQWMRDSRESHYAKAAHYRLHLERGCTIEESTRRLQTIVCWFDEAHGSDAFRKTWLVADSAGAIDTCFTTAQLLGLAGVEIRNDLVATLPSGERTWMASLRSKDPDYFQRANQASVFDCDIRFLDSINLDGLERRPIILSTHPSDVEQEYFDAMLTDGKRFEDRYPEWLPHIQYKYAPVVKSWVELRFGHELCRVFAKSGGRISFLPQGKRWNWVRAHRLRSLNGLNYVSVGTEVRGLRPPPIQYFLPHAVGHAPEIWCGVLGDPVDQSIGDVWHREVSLRLDAGKVGYVKIPLSPDEKEVAAYFLLKIGFHGLSVTSPLKGHLLPSAFITGENGLTSGNTLTSRDGGWLLSDTDVIAMETVLDELSGKGIFPGKTAVFGKGGVSSAILTALEHKGWSLAAHVGAREGWGGHEQEEFVLIIHAAGPSVDAFAHAPACQVWIDLHYRDVQKPPSSISMHMNGMHFYELQAMAQRKTWGFVTEGEW